MIPDIPDFCGTLCIRDAIPTAHHRMTMELKCPAAHQMTPAASEFHLVTHLNCAYFTPDGVLEAHKADLASLMNEVRGDHQITPMYDLVSMKSDYGVLDSRVNVKNVNDKTGDEPVISVPVFGLEKGGLRLKKADDFPPLIQAVSY